MSLSTISMECGRHLARLRRRRRCRAYTPTGNTAAMRKSIRGFLFPSYMGMGAPLLLNLPVGLTIFREVEVLGVALLLS